MFCTLSRLIPSLSHRLCFQIKLPVRQMSNVKKLVNAKPQRRLFDKEKHKLIYECPYILIPAATLRLKYSFPLISLVGITVLYLNNSKSSLVGISLLCLIQIPVFIALSKYMLNTVGKIYVNKIGNLNEVIISAANKSGKRQDYKVSLNDLIVLDSLTKIQSHLGMYLLNIKGSDVTFKLYTRNCKIHDEEACKVVIGEELTQKIKRVR